MYRTFADSKLFCRLPYCRIIFYDISGNLHGPFFNIIFQKNPLHKLFFTIYAVILSIMRTLKFLINCYNFNPHPIYIHFYPYRIFLTHNRRANIKNTLLKYALCVLAKGSAFRSDELLFFL